MTARARSLAALAMVLAAGCDPDDSDPPEAIDTDGVDRTPIEGVCPLDQPDSDPYGDCIESFDPAPQVAFGHDRLPDIVLGPPAGAGRFVGGEHVAALGCGGSITIAFDGPGIVDGPGPDLVVFENPFATGAQTFAEPARVLVSDDGEDFRAFACRLDGRGTWPPTGCAGIEPVGPDPDHTLDPAIVGGDRFDLADVGLSRARYVRVVDVSIPYFGTTTWCGGEAGGFDLDAVAAVPGP